MRAKPKPRAPWVEVPGDAGLEAEEVEDGLLHYVAANITDGSGERNFFGADLDAVLRVAAFLNSTVAHERLQTLLPEHFARGVHVEQTRLGNGGGADKSCALIELWTRFHAAAAAHALGELVGLLLHLGQNPWTIAKGVGSVDGNPGFDDLQILEEDAAIDLEVTENGELGKRLNCKRLLQIVYQSRARHARLAVDQHRAGAADLLQAIGVVVDGSRRLTVARHRIQRDFHEQRGHVQAMSPCQLEFLPVGLAGGRCLALDLEKYVLIRHEFLNLFAFRPSEAEGRNLVSTCCHNGVDAV